MCQIIKLFKTKNYWMNCEIKIIQNLIDNNTHQVTLEDYVKTEIDRTLEGHDLTNAERSYIYNLIDNEINGYGPITDLLKDNLITEIMVNKSNEIYIELNGSVVRDDSISFINDDHIIRTIQRMIQPLGRT